MAAPASRKRKQPSEEENGATPLARQQRQQQQQEEDTTPTLRTEPKRIRVTDQEQHQQEEQRQQKERPEEEQRQPEELQEEEEEERQPEEQQPESPVPELPKQQEEQQRLPGPLRRSRSMSLRNGSGEALTENFTQDLRNVFGHYQDSVANLERLQLLADSKGGSTRGGAGGGGGDLSSMFSQQQPRRGGRLRGRESPPLEGCSSPDSCMEFELHPGEIRSMEIKSADEYGAKFVTTFRALMLRGSGCPSRSSQQQLATIVANNEMHKSALVSVQAAAALEELREVYPATELRVDGSSIGGGEGGGGERRGGGGGGDDGEGGLEAQKREDEVRKEAPSLLPAALLVVNSGSWDPKLVEEVQRWSEAPPGRGETTPQRSCRRSSLCRMDFWDVVVMFVDLGKERALGGGGAWRRRADGALLMLEQVVAGLADDYGARVEAAAAAAAAAAGPRSGEEEAVAAALPNGASSCSSCGSSAATKGSFLGRLLEVRSQSLPLHRHLFSDTLNPLNLCYDQGSPVTTSAHL